MKLPESFPICRIREGDGWRVIDSSVEYANEHITLENIKMRTPSRSSVGQEVNWLIAKRKNACVIAPRTPESNFVLIRQERLPAMREFWEFPAGQIDDKARKEDPELIVNTALRELEEESGLLLSQNGGELLPLGYFFSSQGFTDEHAYLFLATNCVPSPHGKNTDQGEAILENRETSPSELRQMIADGVIIDANTLSACSRMMAMNLL